VNRNCRAVCLCLLVCFFALLGAMDTSAQQGTASIVGTVMDPQGNGVAAAKVTLSDPSSGVTRETTTDEQGRFQFLSLQPSGYVVRIEAAGFKNTQTDKIEALVSITQKVIIKLELGTMSETVTVTEGAIAPVNTTDATIGNAFDSRQILALPFEGRDPAGLLSLQPGVVYIGNNLAINDNVDARNGALNGGRSDQANLILDGVDNNTQATGKAFVGAVRSTLDSIDEFRVTTVGDNADQGRSSGGQITLVTKSGTNSFHGSAYEQNRPTITAANDWFNKHAELSNGKPNIPGKVIRNTFGGSLGGPILKDRLFFFGTYEGGRLAENLQVNRNVPSANLRDGVILYPCAVAAQCPGGSIQGISGQSYQIAPGSFGVGPTQIAQMDPNCVANKTCPSGPGVNMAVVNQLSKYPLPNNSSTCGNADGFNISCLTFSAPNPQHLNTSIGKIDYNITRSGSHRLFLRGNYQTDRTALPPQFPGQPAADVLRDTSRALAVGYTAVLSNTVVNSFHYGFTRQSQDNLGIEGPPIVTFRFIDDFTPSVLSQPTNEQSFTTKFHIPVHNWVDDVTWTKGKHTLQFGTNIRLINNDRATDIANISNATTNPLWFASLPAGSGGSFDPGCSKIVPLPPGCTWNFPAVDPNNSNPYNFAVVNLVGLIPEVTAQYNRTTGGNTNMPQVIPQGTLVPKDFKSWEYDWYVQDSWRVTPTLTVTAGLRYTILEPPYETHGNQVSPNASLSQYVNSRAVAMEQGQTTDQIITFSPSGQALGKHPFWPYDYKDLGPRLAIAYAPNPSGGFWRTLFGGAGKSSIRAGFGIVYDHYGEALVDTFDQAGSFGLATVVSNPASQQTIDHAVRFTGINNIPTSSADGLLLNPAPMGGYPFTPPVSTPGNTLQQITFGFDDRLKTPYSETVDLAFTRELAGGLVFSAAYVGRFAHRLLQQRDLAMPLDLKDPKSGTDYFAAATAFAKLANAGTPVSQVPQIPYWENLFPGAAGISGTPSSCTGSSAAPGQAMVANPTATQSMYELFFCNWGSATLGASNFINVFDSNCFPACVSINGVQTPFAFYNKEFSALYAWSSIGASNYNAGQFTLRSRPTHGLQFDFNYVVSKSIDVGSDAERAPTFGGLSAVVNTWAPTQLRGISDFDTRHQINSNWVYDLPVGHGRRFGSSWNRFADTLLGGWQLSGIYRWTSGFPFTIGAGSTFNTNFQLSGDAVPTGALPKTGLFHDANGNPFAFNPTVNPNSEFRLPYPGESGVRNNFRGQGFFGVDLGTNKTFRLTERQTLRFSAYAYNLTNSVRFDPATITFNSALTNTATVGAYSGTLTKPRVMEFALRYQF
jgi:Carboxypeptidase regulatory-like domain/TonB dependent receptor